MQLCENDLGVKGEYMQLKVMISQPMNGKTDEEILFIRKNAKKYLESIGYDVVDTFFQDGPSGKEASRPIYFLGKSLKAMAFCNVVYFCKGWENTRGCRIEHAVASEYGLKILYQD